MFAGEHSVMEQLGNILRTRGRRGEHIGALVVDFETQAEFSMNSDCASFGKRDRNVG